MYSDLLHAECRYGVLHIYCNVAIYHLETKIITRDVGRSVVAAAAYISCSKIYNGYDGIQYDQSESRPRKRKSLDEWER